MLADFLDARSPSGYEGEAQAVADRWLGKAPVQYWKDALGNRCAAVNPAGDPVLMLAGHMDELGLIIKYVDDNGFLYFDTIGGCDMGLLPGRRVIIHAKGGPVKGVTGKRAVHLMEKEERNKVPKIHNLWIDIGVKNKKEALKLVRVGDAATFEPSFEMLRGTVAMARAFDDKAGTYVVCEAVLRLAKVKSLRAKVVAVATVQEEVGTRGAIPSAFAVKPHVAVAVDVGHATDHPDCDNKKHGAFKLGGGPILTRGANINPFVFNRLAECAEKEDIPYQIEANPGPTGTDAWAMQISREGVATGLVSIPLRYMHTTSEVADLMDVENAARLLVAFAKSLKKGEYGLW